MDDSTSGAPRRLIVDGMNVIGSRPDGWWKDRPAAQLRLAERLEAWATANQVDLLVVFDGAPQAAVVDAADRIRVGFAAGGRDAADHEIVARVDADDDPTGLTVVSSDKVLADRIGRRGAAPLMSGRLLEELEAWEADQG